MRRVVVLGETSAGKTTFSRALAEALQMPVIELDALFWGPGWTPTPRDQFRERVAAAAAGDAWVIDGSYSGARDLVWPRADTIVWLDPPFPVLLWRLFLRTNRRILTREKLWNGNRERVDNAYFSRSSLYVWLFGTHGRHQREWPLALGQHPHLRVVRFRSSREAARWLERVTARSADDGPAGR